MSEPTTRPTYTAREAALIIFAAGVALSLPILSVGLIIWILG